MIPEYFGLSNCMKCCCLLKWIQLREEEVWKRESSFECFSLRSRFDIQVHMLIRKLQFKGMFSDATNFENPQDYQMFI